mmetsp:Transcript_48776/g.130914  ORF Transcript_48776/g.130914 Transcript_48776/m.130914 type:complete len:239 (-) Transcript_48776:242-958(-)
MHAASGAPCHDELVAPERVFERELQRGISAAQPEDEKPRHGGDACFDAVPCEIQNTGSHGITLVHSDDAGDAFHAIHGLVPGGQRIRGCVDSPQGKVGDILSCVLLIGDNTRTAAVCDAFPKAWHEALAGAQLQHRRSLASSASSANSAKVSAHHVLDGELCEFSESFGPPRLAVRSEVDGDSAEEKWEQQEEEFVGYRRTFQGDEDFCEDYGELCEFRESFGPRGREHDVDSAEAMG